MNGEFTTTAVHFVTLSTREHINVHLAAQFGANAAATAGVSCQPLCTHRHTKKTHTH